MNFVLSQFITAEHDRKPEKYSFVHFILSHNEFGRSRAFNDIVILE